MMTLVQAAAALSAQARGVEATFTGVGIDSRTIGPGELFVAIRGERFDGHEFVMTALERGAAGAVVERKWIEGLGAEGSRTENGDAQEDLPLIPVDDTRIALGRLAAHWRDGFEIPLAALTGSNGKTTVKEMLASVLREAARPEPVLATEGNLNNDLGVPLTLLKLRAAHRYAVLEIGMNHPGEIAYCAGLARPDVVLVTNAQEAHLLGLGSVEAVARAKGELYEALGPDGIAVVNSDEPHAPLWRGLAGASRVLEFGLEQSAAVSVRYTLAPKGSEILLNTPAGETRTQLQVPGLHNVKNALAASAAAYALDVPLAAIAAGLAKFSGVKGRLEHKPGLNGAELIDDSYNANPASVAAAVAVLAAAPGRRILVLGDMGELGDKAAKLHRETGTLAKRAGIDRLFTLGRLSAAASAEFGAGAMHFERIDELIAELTMLLALDVTLLVKGSRFMQMERVVTALQAER
jgi:UDP-N-acetylmuramoyl-tripeptide--D-alanyl-D-alanine ligase